MLSWAFTFSYYASPSWSLRAAARNSFRRISRSTVGLLNCPAPLFPAGWFNALMSDLINDAVSSARARSFSSRLSLESLGPRDRLLWCPSDTGNRLFSHGSGEATSD